MLWFLRDFLIIFRLDEITLIKPFCKPKLIIFLCIFFFVLPQRQLSRVPDDWLNGSRRLLGGRSRTNSAVYIEPTRSELTEPLFERGCQGNKSKSADHLPNAELNLPTINLKCFRDDPLLMNEETTSSLPQSQPPITLSPPPAPL